MSSILRMNKETAKTITPLVPKKVMDTIVEAAKVHACLRDLMILQSLEPNNGKIKEFNPSRRDSE